MRAIKSILFLACLLVSVSCVDPSAAPSDDEQVSVSQHEVITYVLTVTNLKPTTQDLLVIRPVMTATLPSDTTLRLLGTTTEFDVSTSNFFLVRAKSNPGVLTPAVRGVDFSAVTTQVN